MQKAKKSFPLQEGQYKHWYMFSLYMITYCMFTCAFIYFNIFCTGESEEFDSSEAIRKFKTAKQKKTIVSVFKVLLELYAELCCKYPSPL